MERFVLDYRPVGCEHDCLGEFVKWSDVEKIIQHIKPIIEAAEKNLQYSVEDLHKGYWQGTKFNLSAVLEMLEGK